MIVNMKIVYLEIISITIVTGNIELLGDNELINFFILVLNLD